MAATFWRPGTARPGSSLDRDAEAEGSADFSNAANRTQASASIQVQRSRLPIARQRETILYALEQYPVLVVIGQTGSGKTTQLPQFLAEAGWAAMNLQIAVTQPRRISAISVASRVAQEMGTVLGDEVGYSIRFEDLSHPTRTRIRFLTDGALLIECMRDPLLSRYSVVMIDEAHERGAYTDLLLGLLKKIRHRRPELRIIVSSATLDASNLLDFFNSDAATESKEAMLLTLEGRMFPVHVSYLNQPCSDYVQQAIDTIWSIHLNEEQGDILVFLTGRDEIDRCLQAVADRLLSLPRGSLPLHLLPLHAGLSPDEQVAIFAQTPRGTRKCIVATNIAEASVTIDGIRYVIDSGFVKMRLFNPKTSMDVLATVPISQASASQRAGRAGRTSPGKCYRLWPESEQTLLSQATPPELARTDITPYILRMKALGIDNLARFDYLPPAPPSGMMVRSLEFLAALGALDEWGRFTTVGEQMAELPLEPMMAKAVLASAELGCTSEMLSIAAMISVSNPFVIPDEGRSKAGAEGELERRKFIAEEGDHLTLLNVFNAFSNPRVGKQSARWCGNHRLNFKALSRAVAIRAQVQRFLVRFGIDVSVSCQGDVKRLLKAVVSGYFKNAARQNSRGEWRSVRDQTLLHIHPSSVLFNREIKSGWVTFSEVVQTSRSYMRDVTAIERDWLVELAPHFYRLSEIKMPQH